MQQQQNTVQDPKVSILALVIAIALAAMTCQMSVINFHSAPARTFDEMVFHRLALQMQVDMNDYHTLAFWEKAQAEGKRLPDYFSKPLYKHPPLFSYCIMLSHAIFGPSIESSSYVPAFFAAATVLVVFMLGRILAGPLVGLAAALLLALHPIHILCSQKIWLASTLAFFTTLALLLVILGRQKNQLLLFLLASACIGLAALTKYPGILMLPILAVPVIRARPPKLVLVLFFLLPFLMLVPWILWNLEVYGIGFFYESFFIHFHKGWLSNPIILGTCLLGLTALAVTLIVAAVRSGGVKRFLNFSSSWSPPSPQLLVAGLVLGFLAVGIFHGLLWNYIPLTGWKLGQFRDAPFSFYPERIVTYSSFFLAGFLGLAQLRNMNSAMRLTLATAIALLVFFILWRNYQCRYVLPVLAPLSVVAAAMLARALNTRAIVTLGAREIQVRWLLLGLMGYATLRLLHLNATFSYQNYPCYF